MDASGGLAAQAMDFVLGACIDHGSADAADKLVLKAAKQHCRRAAERELCCKACGSSVVSVFTSPINYVSVIQRLGVTLARPQSAARHPVLAARRPSFRPLKQLNIMQRKQAQ